MKSIWSGYLSFGLINIPVNMYSAARERVLNFKLLDKHGLCPVSYVRVCRDNQKEVKYEDIVRGYQYRKGDYVVLSDKDFEAAHPKKSKTVDVISFAKAEEVDPIFFDKPYYLEPAPKAEKAYVLLREALKRTNKVGVAKFIMKDREHLAIIKPEGKAIMLVQLRFNDEIVPANGIRLPSEKDLPKKEMEVALLLINKLTEHFKSSKYHDTYNEKLEKIIQRKAKGKKIPMPKKQPVKTTQVSDLMSQLKKSLEREKVSAR